MRAAILVALGLALLAPARGQAVDCAQPAPCLSTEAVNASIDALKANAAATDGLLPDCQGLADSLEALVEFCEGDLDQPAGCACSETCVEAVDEHLGKACLESIVQPTCAARTILEDLTKVNILNLVLHLVNDCAGIQSTCLLPPGEFDPAVCEAAPAA